ncbi:hypothetical protein BSKO_05046 [Bryopsis sp. KO-2023]|nr:hypothetical protein BSKO_05046 [Bryopsis sp. KO-2023]
MDLEHLLPSAVLRNIGAQQYEKRKLAALEVEQLMKKLAAGNDRGRIKVLLGRLTDDFALSGLANHRKGGLLCLAAATVGLKQFYEQLKFDYLGQIVRPVAASLSDQDSRVRYYACEALFNITKAMQDEFITDQGLFIEVYSALFKLYGDPDEHVQNAAQHLDEVLKSIVMSSASFDMDIFVQVLKEFLFTLDPHKRQFLIGWVTALFSVPALDMLSCLPDIVGGMLGMLSDEHKEIRHATSKALQEFLLELSSASEDANIDYQALVTVLLARSKSHQADRQVCLTAMRWLNVVVEIAHEEIVEQYGMMVTTVLSCISHSSDEVQKSAFVVNRSLLKMGMERSWDDVDVGGVLDAISKELSSSQPPTRLEALHWFEFLLKQKPSAVLSRNEVVLNAVLDALMMNWEKVEEAALGLLTILAQQEGQFRNVMEALLNRFRGSEGVKLLHRSGAHIMQRLCMCLGCREVYIEVSSILDRVEGNDGFEPLMIQALNVLLVTAPEAAQLQEILRRGLGDKDSRSFFLAIFPSWCRFACAALSLCFLSQSYGLAWKLISVLGSAPCGPSVEAISQIVKLVRLLEAPAFAFLRLQLLEPQRYPELLRCLHGLLMLLPQTDAFRTLFVRLKSVPSLPLSGTTPSTTNNNSQQYPPTNSTPGVEYSDLIQIFERRQNSSDGGLGGSGGGGGGVENEGVMEVGDELGPGVSQRDFMDKSPRDLLNGTV